MVLMGRGTKPAPGPAVLLAGDTQVKLQLPRHLWATVRYEATLRGQGTSELVEAALRAYLHPGEA
jgi:hypothetical protein